MLIEHYPIITMKSDRNKETGGNDYEDDACFIVGFTVVLVGYLISTTNLILGFFTCKFFGDFFASFTVITVVLLR